MRNDAVLAPHAVLAPDSLVRDRSLSPSAKLIWLLSAAPATLSRLVQCSDLCRNTVLTALADLTATGWCLPDGSAVNRDAQAVLLSIPRDLLGDRSVSVQGKILYAQLQLTPGFTSPAGSFSYRSLGAIVGIQARTVRCAVADLIAAGWLRATQTNQRAPIEFSLCDPARDHARAMLAATRRRLNKPVYKGEALMRAFLSLLIATEQFEDNATPGFLVNPLTGEHLQLDRFYPRTGSEERSVAFEYNGAQHDGPTELFSAETAADQEIRDLIKLGICQRQGIALVVVHAEDLSLEAMREKIGQLLPLRDLNGHERLIAYLQGKGRRYRAAAND